MADNQRADPQTGNGHRSADEEPPAGEKPEGFQRFEDLMRKLVRVPKSEVDEKRKTA